MKTSTSERKHRIQWTARIQLDDRNFADDLVLLSHTQQQMQEKTTSVAAASAPMKQNKLDIHEELNEFNNLSTINMTTTSNPFENTNCITLANINTTINNKQSSNLISNCILSDYRQAVLHSPPPPPPTTTTTTIMTTTATTLHPSFDDRLHHKSLSNPTNNFQHETIYPSIKFSVSNILNRH
ncbi:unnamed protein product [Schistosoma margrebowiei]|uniref:Uncharacterized protein n=1 Tax=Schistosoma margrebowiei TaxID=48269 RepID=A0A183LIB0_9TREM|nr:unnamed protein product [Schistosoma margrebowiei]